MKVGFSEVKTVLGCMAVIGFLCIPSFADMNRNAETMILEGGRQGEVFFPHRQHQTHDPENCLTCHDLFPQVKGGIALMITEEKLKARKVMNSQCIKCHRETAKAGNPSGPRSCTTCHKK